MTAEGDLDRARIGELHERELTKFRRARPRSLAMLGRARAHMPNGVPMAWMASDNDQPVYIDHGLGPGFTDIDETHTHVVGPGGATGMWGLDPDMVTIGKAVAGGLPMGRAALGVAAFTAVDLRRFRSVGWFR